MKLVEETPDLKLHIRTKIKDIVSDSPMRRIVERAFVWPCTFQYSSKDYEILTLTAENMVRIAVPRIRIAKRV